jgi:flagellar hook-associated protein 2
MSTTSGLDLSLSGLASGLDWKTLVSQLAEVERAPERRLQSEQSTIQQRNNAYGSIVTQLGVLQNRVNALKAPGLFDSRTGTAADATVLSASVSDGAALGTYTFAITQLATASRQLGASHIGAPLNATNDVSGLVLGSAGFGKAVTAGTFTVNGQQVTIATTDTLKGVFDKISTATGGAVTASYNSTNDTISLNSSSPIVLGSATDTSNFLQATKLYNTGTGTITSAGRLGSAQLTGTLSNAKLAAPLTDGGSGAGQFKINGVSINFSTTSDSLQNVIDRINSSTAGVTASYDSVNDRLMLTSKSTGDMGISLQDVTGNFLAATGVSTGTLSRGKNLLYSVNGGDQIVSQSNTITADSSGIAGLSITALAEDTTTVAVSSDGSKIKQAINDFIAAYNQAQSLIDTQTASSTDANGKVTAGLLASESEANDIASVLRRTVDAVVSSLGGSIKSLDDLGITANGNDNTLTVSDAGKLDSALANNLNEVKSLFTDSTSGLAISLAAYLDKTAGDDGTLVAKQDSLTKQSANIDTQIADLERQVQAYSERMTASFVAMETAQATINQQLTYLTKQFSSSTSS